MGSGSKFHKMQQRHNSPSYAQIVPVMIQETLLRIVSYIYSTVLVGSGTSVFQRTSLWG